MVFSPPGEDEAVVRTNVSSIKKLTAEGCLEVTKTILGWVINTHELSIKLEDSKASRWKAQIESMLGAGLVGEKQLESLLEKLTHAGYIVPLSRYFLNRLRWRLKCCKKFGSQRLSPAEVRDLKLWLIMLSHMSNKGVQIDHITLSVPEVICYSDACEFGMGGLLESGVGWRLQLPPNLVGKFSLNVLEFIAAVITIHLAIGGRSNTRILAITDSTSALGWLHRASFDPGSQGCLDQVARRLATMVFSSGSSLCGIHVKGSSNVLADSLSRDFHLANEVLDLTFTSLFYPQVVSAPFRISSPSFDVISWMRSLKPSKTVKAVSAHRRSRSCLGTFLNGKSSWQASVSAMSGWTSSPRTSDLSWWRGSSRLYEEISSARKLCRSSFMAQLRERSARSGQSFVRT